MKRCSATLSTYSFSRSNGSPSSMLTGFLD
jgi:hypothetical protein